MSSRVVIDACALYPFGVRDALLALAEKEFYDVVWSQRILEEMRRNLVNDRRMTDQQATSTLRAMITAFPDASVPVDAVELREPTMTNHVKDRHVLAAAVAGDADVIVTMNLRDFADADCAPWRVRAVHPDDSLLEVFVNDRARVIACLREQVQRCKRPPVSFDQHLDGLSRTVPRFVSAVRG